jgi:branched-chain amino acid transport system substrate-binding protein
MLGQLRDGGGQGMNWTLLPVASDQNWGAASTQLVHALMDEHALAIVALDRDAAHLAEQLALKAFVPVVALSEDKKLTSTNVPWIFRLPAATSPASAIGMLQSASTKSGMSPEKLRDVLASGQSIDGIAFLSTGEPKIQ